MPILNKIIETDLSGLIFRHDYSSRLHSGGRCTIPF